MQAALHLPETEMASDAERLADAEFRAAEALQRLSRCDPVTGLPNRRQFVEDFGFGVSSRPVADDDVVAVMVLVQPAQYGSIVRALGHSFAEEIVRLGANRLRKALPKGQEVYQVDPLSFAFAMSGFEGDGAPEDLADLMMAFAEPLICNGIPVRNRATFGLTRLRDVGSEPSELLRGGLVAAQDSRKRGCDWGWYERKTDQAHFRSFRILADLGRLMDGPRADIEAQFDLFYQPKVDLHTGACTGAEGLMRWTHPSLGAVSPAEFVPLAEATAAITPLTRWVFEQGVARRGAWNGCGIDGRISLNVSPLNLSEPDFADFVLETCRNEGVSPEQMEIEFTESAQTLDSDLTLAQLGRLRAEGVSVAIDDFGSGYSNMRYLRSIPADVMKIDKDFILTLDTCEKNRKIVPTIIDLAHHLGFKVVAEGIETQTAYETLRGWGCDEGQGFHMSRPLPEAEFRAWYARHGSLAQSA